jgi:hypothetical protein
MSSTRTWRDAVACQRRRADSCYGCTHAMVIEGAASSGRSLGMPSGLCMSCRHAVGSHGRAELVAARALASAPIRSTSIRRESVCTLTRAPRRCRAHMPSAAHRVPLVLYDMFVRAAHCTAAHTPASRTCCSGGRRDVSLQVS